MDVQIVCTCRKNTAGSMGCLVHGPQSSGLAINFISEELLTQARARIAALEAENARLREDKERLEIVRQHLANAPELNPANYDHDEVVELNAACIMAYFLAGGKPVNEEVPEYKAAQAIIAARKEQKA